MAEKTRAWKWLVGVLAILNIVLLVTIWRNPPKGADQLPNDRPGNKIVHDLNFNAQQEKQFEALKQAHHEEMIRLQRNGRELRDGFFDLLKNPSVDSMLVHEKAKAIAANQEKIEMVTFNHFRDVRRLCDDTQKKKFDEIIKDVLHHMMRPPGGKRDDIK